MKHINNLERRDFLKLGALGSLSYFVPSFLNFSLAQNAEPHFFLQLTVTAGFDWTYLFDSKPLEMTKNGLQSNYFAQEPIPWTGANGGVCLTSPAAQPLKPYFQDFSVLNGVMMSTSFDGHIQNLQYLYTGNPFGGDVYTPHFNRAGDTYPLDGLQSGFKFADAYTNFDATIPLDVNSAKNLVSELKKRPPMDPSDLRYRYLMSRFLANGQGAGQFSQGSLNMAEAFGQSPNLVNKLRQVQFGENTKEFVQVASEFFKHGIIKSVIIEEGDLTIDTHDIVNAKAMVKTSVKIADKIAKLIKHLKTTPFNDHKSLMDVTTFVVTSEFSRSMRQIRKPIDDTGTDHNQFSNTVLVGGKGIKTGCIFGASDFNSSSEELSKAHLSLDALKLKAFAKPFDHRTMKVRQDLPEVLDVADYMTYSHFANTLFKLYGVSKDHYRTIDRNGTLASTLDGLLT